MNAYLLPSIEFGPAILRRLFTLLPEDQLDVSLEEGRFTPRQVIAHLADWEPIMRQRIATACTQGLDAGGIRRGGDGGRARLFVLGSYRAARSV